MKSLLLITSLFISSITQASDLRTIAISCQKLGSKLTAIYQASRGAGFYYVTIAKNSPGAEWKIDNIIKTTFTKSLPDLTEIEKNKIRSEVEQESTRQFRN